MDRNSARIWIQVFGETAMKRIFVIMLLSFLSSLFIFLAVMTGVFYLGFKRSLAGWGSEKRITIEEQIQRELKDILPRADGSKKGLLEARIQPLLPYSTYLAVYNSEKELLYIHSKPRSRGGAGMNQERFRNDISKIPMKAVKTNGKISGYYALGSVGFGADRANINFLESMRKTVWFSLVFSFLLALLFAFLFSKRISNSAKTVATGINRMSQGDLSVRIQEKGITEISHIAQSANRLSAKLEKEEGLRRQWASDIAHDLRTPVTALKSQLEGMAEGVLDISKRRINKVLNELLRVEVLVNDLGELTMLESPEMKIHRSAIDASGFFQDLKDRFLHQLQEKNISVSWEKKTSVFSGDENLLLRAVSNFISNAIRHTPERGRITVTLRSDTDRSVISIFNTGEAIPEEEIKRVFERLYRGEYARKTPGSGLGLTISKKIAELHGGSINIQSSHNYGTTIEMSLPV